MSMAEAVAQLEDGMTIGIGGWGPRRKPMAAIREILRSDVKDLTVVSYGGADVGMLCAAGKVKKVVFAFVTLDFIPLEPYFRIARQKGEIDILEIDEGMMLLGLRAAAWKSPFIPTQVGLGTDIITMSDELKVIDSPYDDKEWVAMPALNLDASFVHVNRASTRGVCQITSPDHYMDDWFARASEKCFVTTEEIVDNSFFEDEQQARFVFWERSMTSAVIHAPGGAHPSSCAPNYGFDVPHFKAYNASAKEGGFAAYSEEFLSGSEADYQAKVGGIKAINAIPLAQY